MAKGDKPKRGEGGRYLPGQSGNPAGPPAFNPVDERAKLLAQADTLEDEVKALTAGPSKMRWAETRCKLCRSPHRARAEEMRGEGKSYAVIADYLRDQGETTTLQSVRRHLMNHVDISKLVRADYVRREAEVTEQADKATSDLERLGAYIERASRLEKALTRHVGDCVASGKAPPMSVSHALETVTGGLRQAIKLRQDLVGGQPADDVDELLAALWQTEDTPAPPKHEQNEPIRSEMTKSASPGAEKTG